MPFFANTPESLIGRTDSKNPSTTCRGITSGGRPCRRPLAAASPSAASSPPAASPFVPPRDRAQQLLRVDDDPRNPDLYCWQHKDQAKSSARSSPGPQSRTNKLSTVRQESFDSLIGRLGIVEAEQNNNGGRKPSRKPVASGGPPTSPSARKSSSGGGEKKHGSNAPQKQQQNGSNISHTPKRKVIGKTSFCFCFTIPVYEDERPARPRPRPAQQPSPSASNRPTSAKIPSSSHPGNDNNNHHLAPSSAHSQRPSLSPSHHSSAQSTVSQTSQYISLIPPSVQPETMANLLKELSKPVSANDEAGYIYVFWLTPESEQPTSAPTMADSNNATRNFLAPPRPDMRQRRTSDVVQSFATHPSTSKRNKNTKTGNKTVLLKIGRASNVQRRLNEWQRQCGYNLSLIRYYPYVSTSSSSTNLPLPSTPRKMPHSHKVERLVHIELEGHGLRVNSKVTCDACGRIHREWFEVEATRAGVNTVDEIVKRWSDWDEGNVSTWTGGR